MATRTPSPSQASPAAPTRPRGFRAWWWKALIVVALVLVGIVYLGGGWYFSGLIHADLLEPEPSTQSFESWVVDLTPETIALSADDLSKVDHPGVMGLRWEQGYTRVGPVISVDGNVVVRERLDPAAEPPLCPGGDDGECDLVDVDGFAYPDGPADAGLEVYETAYGTALGPMAAWLVPAGDSTTWAIHVHGRNAPRREFARILPVYADAGITSMVIDHRNDPGAPPDPSGLLQFGRTEWEDVQAAVVYALDGGAKQIVLSGNSTGAAAILAFLENSDATEGVVGVVFDAPNIDVGWVVQNEARNRTIPGTSLPLPPGLSSVAMWLAGLRWDVDWRAIDYLERPEILDVPALVFHGSEDGRVPPEISEALAAARPDVVTLVLTEGARHVTSWNVDPAAYEMRLADYLETLTR